MFDLSERKWFFVGMAILLSVVLSLFGVFYFVFADRAENSWQEQYDLGVRYLSEGNYEEAILKFSAAIEIDPKQIPAYIGRAEAYVSSGATEENCRKALADYETVLSMDDSITVVWINAANLYEQLGETETALEILQDGLEKAEDFAAVQEKLEEMQNKPAETEPTQPPTETAPPTQPPQTEPTQPPTEATESSPVNHDRVSLVNWLGRTTDELIAQFGVDYYTDYWEGGLFIKFSQIPAMFFYDAQTHVVFLVEAGFDERLVYNLTADMTYPELVAAVPTGISVPEPQYWYSEMDGLGMYSASFEIGQLQIDYEWLEDPYTNAAHTARLRGTPPEDALAEDALELGEQGAALSFSDIPESFISTSGAGAWSTEITLSPDGSFTGYFHDSDMGDTGPDYPNGTVYYCDFTGKFSQPVQVNAYTYRMTLENMVVEDPEGYEYIQDGIRYIAGTPYGFDGPTEYYLYLPGMPVNMMPEACREWVGRLYGTNTGPYDVHIICSANGALPFVGETD